VTVLGRMRLAVAVNTSGLSGLLQGHLALAAVLN
jgi:hypothetical protein